MREDNGIFRRRKGFSIIPNDVARNKNLSHKAKGLYLHIMSYITCDNFKLTKAFLMSESMEGEKAFDSAWNELKNAGYLKVYFIQADKGRWNAEYELLEEATNPTVHTFYCAQNGDVTSTNIDRANKRSENQSAASEPAADEEVEQETDRTPKKGVTVKVPPSPYPQNGTYRDGSNGKGGNNSNTDSFETDYNTNSIQFNSIREHGQQHEPEETEMNRTELTMEQLVNEECIGLMCIPYHYKEEPERLEYAIHTFLSWDTFLENAKDTPRDAAYITFTETLIAMCSSSEPMRIKGALISYAKVIDKLNYFLSRKHEYIKDYGYLVLEDFSGFVINKFLTALANKSITNYQKYMQSIIWEGLQDYDLNTHKSFIKEGVNPSNYGHYNPHLDQ